MTLRAFGAPHRYIQGPGALAELAALVPLYGRRPLVTIDVALFDALNGEVQGILGPHVEKLTFAKFAGECSARQIDELAELAASAGSDLFIVIGGGKAIDTTKGARIKCGGSLIVVPSVASNDAPTSRLSVIYTDAHALSEVRLMTTNPDAVVVDTAIIARAPRRFFVAGIGDALSKKFEVEQCFNSGGLNFYKARPTNLAVTIADQCYRVLRRDAETALVGADAKVPNEAFENVVEATILLSGLGFESGGLSIAHSLTRGFSAIPALNNALHGEQVAFGTLVQLCLEGRPPAFLADVADFCRRIGLATNLHGLGCDGDVAETIRIIAQRSYDEAPYIRQFAGDVTPTSLAAALEHANRL